MRNVGLWLSSLGLGIVLVIMASTLTQNGLAVILCRYASGFFLGVSFMSPLVGTSKKPGTVDDIRIRGRVE